MKHATKALLWSGLAFPGLGHIYLRLWVRGIVLVLAGGAALWVILSVVLTTALELAAEIQRGTIVPDAAGIAPLVTERSTRAHAATRWPTALLVGLWLIGMVDAWRLGRARDRATAADPSQQPPS